MIFPTFIVRSSRDWYQEKCKNNKANDLHGEWTKTAVNDEVKPKRRNLELENYNKNSYRSKLVANTADSQLHAKWLLI